MKFGYARCSTDSTRQDVDRQRRELVKLGVPKDNIYFEYESGTKNDRVELKRLLEAAGSEGNEIVATEVSRLSRSVKMLCEIIEFVKEKKLKLTIGTSFSLDCTSGSPDPMTLGMVQMWSVFAELEHSMLSARVSSGIENARKKGKKIGRPKKDAGDLPAKFWKYLPQYKKGEITVSDFARVLDCGRNTLYRYLEIADAKKKSDSGELPGQMTIEDINDNKKEEVQK